MPVPFVMYAHLPKIPLLLGAVVLLTGCITSKPLVEQRTPNQLPGAGTYAWDGVAADPSRVQGTATPAMAASAAPEIKNAIERALSRRGYRQAPPDKAAWRISYQAIVENKSEDLAPNDRMLIPRQICGLHGCSVQHQWMHFGPPLRGEAIRNFRQATVRVTIHNTRNGEQVWQGSLANELNEEGLLHRAELHNATHRLLGNLPRVPKDNPWKDVAEAGGNSSR